MRRTVITFMLLFMAAAAAAQSPMSFDDLAAIRRIGAPQLSPDGKWIAFDASTIDMAANYRKSAVYLMPSSGGEPKRISQGPRQDEGPAWSPNGKLIAYVSNRDGDPKQVYLYEVAAGTTRKLTSLGGGASSVKWTPDGSGLVFVSDVYPDCGVASECHSSSAAAIAERPSKARVIESLPFRRWNTWIEPTRAHIIYYPLAGEPRDLTPGAFDAPPVSVGGGDEFDVAPNSLEVAHASNTETGATSTNSDIFLVGGGATKRITSRTGADTSPKYSPDGKWISWLSQSRAGYESDLWELWIYDRAAGTSSRLAPDFPNWIGSVTWAPNSRSLFFVAPEKGKNALYEVTLDGKYRKLHGEGSVGHVAVSPDGNTFYFDRSSLRRPADIYSLTRAGKLTKLTTMNDALLARASTGEVTDMFWSAADGVQVQGHLIKPPGFVASRKYPALVLIHGGPQGAWADSWSYRWNPQIFASHGYVVFMPNPRGSSGFGQKFVEEISQDWAGKVYTDIMRGVDQLAALPYVDASRMGAAGGSYGGYMVNWILGHDDRFRALVSHAGLYNLHSMYGVTEELWFPEWEFAGTPWDKPELYERWSPHRFAKNFKTPTLITHGELDFRVPVGEGMMLFTTLQRRGIPSKLVLFPDEGHWILKPQNSKLWFQTVGDWFDQWVKK